MDIVSLPIEYDRNKIDGRYRIAAIAFQRAKELFLGAKPRVKTRAKKVTTQALEETISNAVEFLTGEKAREAKEESKKLDYRRLLEEREKAGEELSELEKDLKYYLHEKEAADRKAPDDFFGDRREKGFEG